MASSAMEPWGIFGFLPTTHMKTKCVHGLCAPCGVSHVFIFTLWPQYTCTWQINYFVRGKNLNTPIGTPCWDKYGAGSGITGLYRILNRFILPHNLYFSSQMWTMMVIWNIVDILHASIFLHDNRGSMWGMPWVLVLCSLLLFFKAFMNHWMRMRVMEKNVDISQPSYSARVVTTEALEDSRLDIKFASTKFSKDFYFHVHNKQSTNRKSK